MSRIVYGNITKVYPSEGKAVVNFDDRGIASKKLPILYARTFADKESDPMEEGEHVACVMDSNLEDGFIAGAIYSSKEKPPATAGANKWVKEFSDGTIFTYDKDTNNYSVKLGTTEFVINKTTGFKIKKGSESLDSIIGDFIDTMTSATATDPISGALPLTSSPALPAIKARLLLFFGA